MCGWTADEVEGTQRRKNRYQLKKEVCLEGIVGVVNQVIKHCVLVSPRSFVLCNMWNLHRSKCDISWVNTSILDRSEM